MHISVKLVRTNLNYGVLETSTAAIFLYAPTVDGFIFVGTNFRWLNKTDIFVGFKIRGHSNFFMINTENYHFVGTEI